MAVDPVDDCTFWYANEYLKASGTFNWSTRIGTFTFANCLTVNVVSHASGPITGATDVTITGTGFTSPATVSFGGVAASAAAVVNATTITTTTSVHAAGVVDVKVTAGGQSGTCANCFTYVALRRSLGLTRRRGRRQAALVRRSPGPDS